jgi:hypothetical protein
MGYGGPGFGSGPFLRGGRRARASTKADPCGMAKSKNIQRQPHVRSTALHRPRAASNFAQDDESFWMGWMTVRLGEATKVGNRILG